MPAKIGVCVFCEIEIFVEHNVVRIHWVPGTKFRCPKSGAAYDVRQRVINATTGGESLVTRI